MARIIIDNVDLLDITIGNFGCWQIKMVILILLLNIVIVAVNVGNVFLVPSSALWCKSNEDLNRVFFKEHLPCFMGNVDVDVKNIAINYSITACGHLKMSDTLTAEWDLSEEQENVHIIIGIIQNVSTALGGILFGVLSDTFGRKGLLIILILFQTLSSITSSIGNSYVAFLFFKFFSGLLNSGLFVISLTLCVEVIGKKYRTYVPVFYQLVIGTIFVILAVIGCCMYKWREFQLLLAAVNVFFLTYFWFLDESPRWLVANDFSDELIKTLQRASKSQNVHEQIVNEMCLTYKEERASLLVEFKNNCLNRRIIFLCCVWIILGVLWENLVRHLVGSFSNPYSYILIDGIVILLSTPALVLGGYVSGRQFQNTIGTYLAIFCICVIWIITDDDAYDTWIHFIFTELGLLGLNISISTTALFTCELYPTILRCTGLGLGIVFFHLGIAIVYLIYAMSVLSVILPLTIFVCMALTYCYLQMFLPETKHETLPNVLSEIRDEDMEDDY